MTKSDMIGLKRLEGCRVCVTLAHGGRIDDGTLVSCGRGRTATLWMCTNGVDAFVPADDVVRVSSVLRVAHS